MPEQKKNNLPLLISFVLLAGVFLLYGRVHAYEFMCYDDDLYITKNGYVQSGLTAEGIKWAFTKIAGTGTYWHPVTWLSHMLDWELFKGDAGKHHLVNVFFHAGNVLLLFYLLRRLTKSLWPSAIVAALFAFHPLQVDSVAWIAERKNVLSTLFWLLTTLAYVRYVELAAKRDSKTTVSYVLVILLFAIGLMCKPMLVTLPCTLLLLDFWPLRRIPGAGLPGQRPTTAGVSKLVMEKIPLFLLSGLSCFITIKAHEQLGMIQDGQSFPLLARLGNSVVAYATYLRKLVWPNDLAVFYPLPERWPASQIIISALILIAISALALFVVRKSPAVLFGWLWFLGTLIPVIGILQVHDQAMADRFVYVPLIGIFIALTWGLNDLTKNKGLFLPTSMIAVVLCCAASARQVGYWKNCESLMTHATEVTKNNHLAYNNLGAEFAKQDRLEDARENYTRAVKIKNNYPMAHSNLGVIYAQTGDLEHAMQEFQIALQLDPDYADALCNAGRIYMFQKKTDMAIEHFRHAIKMRPTHADAHLNLGQALGSIGKLDEAIEEFTIASRTPPPRSDAFSNLGVALAQKGRFEEAISALNEALRIDPRSANAENNLGYIYEGQQRYAEAAAHYQNALQFAPNHPDARRNLQRLINRSPAAAAEAKR